MVQEAHRQNVLQEALHYSWFPSPFVFNG